MSDAPGTQVAELMAKAPNGKTLWAMVILVGLMAGGPDLLGMLSRQGEIDALHARAAECDESLSDMRERSDDIQEELADVRELCERLLPLRSLLP